MIKSKSKKIFIKIVRKYLKGKASQDEVLFLEKYYNLFEKELGITSQFSEKEKETFERELLEGILQKTEEKKKTFQLSKISWYKQSAAALILLFIGLGAYYNTTTSTEVKPIILAKNDLPPGTNKAILTLANGSQVVLDSTNNGLVIQQSNTQITKTAKGQLSYTLLKKPTADAGFNSISTPRGGEYQLVLPDGTKVWLNASSSIRFPVAFVGKERNVTISGEAYFEVAKNKKMPFIVSAGKMNVEVLGTHFNVLAYQDEPVLKTTLLEGSVKIINEKSVAYLTPGEQSRLTDKGQLSIKKDIDLNKEVAWTKGQFQFNSNTIQEIMLQLSRWYDVEVVYQGTISNETFSAVVKRSSNISQVLKLMETSGVKFTIEGQKIYVK
ncbi:FecR family protein [Flavobacterium sp. W1B]|uniref:FecR family protein n=1 Tax=Flavobacterium sp. W1B TaxID=3394146 RepID=UPI0039BC2232